MSRSTIRLLALAAIGIAACSDLSGTGANTLALTSAFQTVPAGFSANTNSFDASGDAGLPFFPENIARGGPFSSERGSGGEAEHKGEGPEHERDHHDGFGEGGLRGLLMGGGLGPNFIGAIAFGKGRGRGPFGIFNLPESCTFDAGSGRVSCPDKTERGLTVSASFAFKDASGAAQEKFDTASTNSVNIQIAVQGTISRKDGLATSTVDNASDYTVQGLASGSTQRQVDGHAEAHEDITGVRDTVKFTATRVAGDTTTGLVIPLKEGRPTIPSAGSVIRRMVVSITPEGGTASTRDRREVITFNGTNVISVQITQDGTTKDCTITLPGKKLVCE